MMRSLARGLSQPPRALPGGYLGFVRRETQRLFRKGWDASLYPGFVYTNTPGLAGTVDSSRLEGGCMGAVQDQVELIDRTLGLKPYELPACEGQLMVVQSAGKPRPLTKFSSEELCLRPLHKSIYEHLSRTAKWLCRGDPTAEKLARAGFRRDAGGELVSGDYRSATDNLSLEVAEVILSVVLETSAVVPTSVKDHAMAILRPLLFNLECGLEFEVSRGQMMGSYLSFPLLCIQNFLSFEYARREEGHARMPLLINGDDILFQAPVGFAQRWMRVVMELGLEVEETKTSVDPSYGSLNSTLFEWDSSGHLFVVPTLRFGMLRSVEFINSLGASFHSFVRGQPTEIAWKAARTFFSWHLGALRSARVFPDELGFRGSLAFRMSRIFGLVGRDVSIVQLPIAPVPHNVVLQSSHVTMVAEERLGPELRLLNDRQMASWKFTVDYRETRVRSAIRYCLQLSSIRRPMTSIRSQPLRSFLTDDFSWRRVRRKRFFRPLFGGEKEIPVFDGVLQSQEVPSDWEILPTYEDSVEEGQADWCRLRNGKVEGEPPCMRTEEKAALEAVHLNLYGCGPRSNAVTRPDVVWGAW